MALALSARPRAVDPLAAEIERLWTLEKMNLGPVGYFAALAGEDNEILAVGAANVMLDQGAVPDSIRERMVRLASYQSIQLRAFDFFMSDYDYERARAVLDTPLRPTDALVKRQLAASYGVDPAEMMAIEIERFFRSGEVEPIASAAAAAEASGGWKAALPLLIDLILINPQNASWAVRLGRTLRDANQFALLGRLCEIVDKIGIFPNVSLLFRGALAARSGAAEEGLKRLQQVVPTHLPLDGAVMMAGFRAELLETLGRYEDAYRAYVQQNTLLSAPDVNPGLFAKGVLAKAALQVQGLPRDARSKDFIMCGFARSGTTLLEYALGSHPRIEAFEEIPSFASIHHLFRPTLLEGKPLVANFPAKARARYYREIDRRKKKPGAEIFVDKQPMLSAEARFLKKLFPDKRYIFCIRHPYDVVLSCFRQAFARNVAMDNFFTFEDSCRAYDFAMNQWFSAFDFSSPEVCYIRYDRLVLDFKAEVSRVLAFLGADWHDDVLRFAERAGEREARTPSYAKVRAGVSIGVQTAWRNYAFLFKRQEARPLDRWVKAFGYEAT